MPWWINSLGCLFVGASFGRWFSARKQIAAAVSSALAAAQAAARSDASNVTTVVVGRERQRGHFDAVAGHDDDHAVYYYDDDGSLVAVSDGIRDYGLPSGATDLYGAGRVLAGRDIRAAGTLRPGGVT